MMDYLERYAQWEKAPLSAGERQELEALKGDTEAMKLAFAGELHFGTGGMRAIMGVGSNLLNRHTVRRAAQGMAAWLKTTDLPQRAAIGYDSRHHSREFGEVCAVAFAEAGIQAFLYDRLAPTPMLSFAVRNLGCGCGVVISASHNDGRYNGVKCYGPDGCQLTDEPAAVVTGKIEEIPYFVPEEDSFQGFMDRGLIQLIPQSLWEAYYKTVMAEAVAPEKIAKAGVNVVYTPLCGTGNEPVRHVLGALGANVTVVAVQEKPDGDFKTCEYPNPETDAALNESYKVARQVPCDVVLGTDPDCDRVAIAVPHGNDFIKLTGNELGALLLDYILRARQGSLPEGAEAVRSIVSTPMVDQIAVAYGCKIKKVLTGFKYIGGEILELERQGRADRFVFGFEESCGYLKGTYARDKDAVLGSMLVCEMIASYKLEGKDILEVLEEMYRKYGYYVAYTQSVSLSGADAMEKAAKIMADLRASTPASIGGKRVTAVLDYKARVAKDLAAGSTEPITLPVSNVLELHLEGGSSVIARPSGTEPKLKYYYTAVGKTRQEALDLLERMKADMNR